jgi:hypothetical protein
MSDFAVAVTLLGIAVACKAITKILDVVVPEPSLASKRMLEDAEVEWLEDLYWNTPAHGEVS